MLCIWLRRLVLAACLSLLAPAAGAQEPPLVSNVFIETDLRQALQDVAAQAGVNIIAEPSVEGLVTVELNDVTVEKALQLLLAGTGYQIQREADYYLVYNAERSGPNFTAVAETWRYKVRYLPAETARSLLPNSLQEFVRVDDRSDVLVVTAPQEQLARIEADLAKIDVDQSADTIFVPLDYARAPTVISLLPPQLQRFVRADEDRNTLAITAPDGTLQTILNQVAQIDLPRRPGNFDIPDIHPTEIVKLNNASAETVLALLPPAAQAYVRADPQTNTLAISAPEVLMAGIHADIAAVDVPRKHVMLSARVVVLERGDLLNFGADWKWPTISAGLSIGDFDGLPWQLQIGYSPEREFTNALSLTLNLLSQNNEATIVASPQVLAQDGKEAEIKVTTEEYFQITSESGVFLRADLQQIETGTILRITPHVGRNNEMTLDMNIEVSDVVARGQQNLPVVSRRTAQSTVRLENGGTAAVAGLVDNRSQVGRSGVPGAGNIPLLGRAFRTDKLNHQARQVAVFVTATVVDENDTLAETGRRRPPEPPRQVDEAEYRSELEAALDRIGAPR